MRSLETEVTGDKESRSYHTYVFVVLIVVEKSSGLRRDEATTYPAEVTLQRYISSKANWKRGMRYLNRDCVIIL